MAILIGQTNKYEIYVGKETKIWFFSYQAEYLSNCEKKLCERWKKKYLKKNKLRKDECILLKDKC